MAADRHLLFGLLALQTGLIQQAQLVAAFHAWTCDKSRSLAEHLMELGHLDSTHRPLLEGLAAAHLDRHGGDVEKSLAAVPAGRSTCERLAGLADADIAASIGHLGAASGQADPEADAERTASYSFGTATAAGQRFRVLRPHAKGGLGAVFVALDAELNREVALKQILDQHAADPVNRQRFLLEAEITGGLEHPGIVPIYGLGTYEGGRPFYAMRFIKGDSLKEAAGLFHADLANQGDPGRRALALRKLLRRFTDVCDAIGYAHARGVLHRDIKPGNIIVGRYGETLVVDWGLAKATGRADPGAEPGERTLIPSSASGSAETLPGSALGTPAYMSPEQAEGDVEHLGPRSDVYGLGATLYYVLTGRPPVEGEIGEILRAVQRGDVTPPRRHDVTIDRALEAVCLKAMAHRPGDRYGSPKALSEDIERWMADEPVSAWREPISRRARRWANRNRTAVASAAVALIAGVVGLSTVLAVQTQAKAEVTRALAGERDANVALAASNDALARSKAAVQTRYDLAVEAIETFHTGVSEDFLLKQDQFKELRDRLLKSAQDFYGKLSTLLGKETDVASRRALAASNFELARLTDKVGNQEDALKAHRAVLAARETLLAEPGAGSAATTDVGLSLVAVAGLMEATGKSGEAIATYRRSESLLTGPAGTDVAAQAVLAKCRSMLGNVLAHTGQNTDALAIYRQARASQEALAAAPGAPAVAGRELADTLSRIGILLAATGKTTDAEVEYRRALQIRQKLAADNPGVTAFRSYLSFSHQSLGILLAQTGKPTEAEAEIRRAQAIQEKLAAENPAVIEFHTGLADSHNILGFLLSQMGKPAEGVAAYRRALEIRQKLAADNPSLTAFQNRVAGSHYNLGLLLWQLGKPKEAEAEYRAAQVIQEKLAAENPAVTNFRSRLANSHQSLGVVLAQAGKPKEAEDEYRRAMKIQEKLAAENPAVTDFRNGLAATHNNLGALLLQTGKLTEAEAEHRRALEIHAKLAAENPAVTDLRSRLASSYNNLGELLSQMNKPVEAEAEFRRALQIHEKLATENPAVTVFRDRLAVSHNNLGNLLSRTGKRSEADAEYHRALVIQEKLAADNPGIAAYQQGRALGLSKIGILQRGAGRTSDAVVSFRAAVAVLQRLPTPNPGILYDLAGDQALLAGAAAEPNSGISAAEGDAEADRAMATLRRAVAAGYRDLAHMQADTSFDMLRAREDFRLMMMDLTMPADPFAAAR